MFRQLRDFWDPMLLQDVFGPSNDQANVSGSPASPKGLTFPCYIY